MTMLLGLDLETTGLNPKTDRVIEVGAVLWDLESKRPMVILNDLVNSVTEIPPEASKVNGISWVDINDYGVAPCEAYDSLAKLMARCDYFLGHNINAFDIPFLKEEFARVGEGWVFKPV